MPHFCAHFSRVLAGPSPLAKHVTLALSSGLTAALPGGPHPTPRLRKLGQAGREGTQSAAATGSRQAELGFQPGTSGAVRLSTGSCVPPSAHRPGRGHAARTSAFPRPRPPGRPLPFPHPRPAARPFRRVSSRLDVARFAGRVPFGGGCRTNHHFSRLFRGSGRDWATLLKPCGLLLKISLPYLHRYFTKSRPHFVK